MNDTDTNTTNTLRDLWNGRWGMWATSFWVYVHSDRYYNGNPETERHCILCDQPEDLCSCEFPTSDEIRTAIIDAFGGTDGEDWEFMQGPDDVDIEWLTQGGDPNLKAQMTRLMRVWRMLPKVERQASTETFDPIQGIEEMLQNNAKSIATHQRLIEDEAGIWTICAAPGMADVVTLDNASDFVLGYPAQLHIDNGADPDQPAIRLHMAAHLVGAALTWPSFPQAEGVARRLRQNGIKCHAIAAEDWHSEQIEQLNRLNATLRQRLQELRQATR